MDVKISTKKELKERSEELEKEFNSLRDELVKYIESTHTAIEAMTSHMDELSKEYKEIMEELDKRDGKS